MDAPPFDRVVIDAQGVTRSYTFEQFLQLPLHLRVQHLMNREILFFNGDRPVERRMVLRALMRTEYTATKP